MDINDYVIINNKKAKLIEINKNYGLFLLEDGGKFVFNLYSIRRGKKND